MLRIMRKMPQVDGRTYYYFDQENYGDLGLTEREIQENLESESEDEEDQIMTPILIGM